jgi:coproporphyrinogen III oxidase-like Fe-S oxidoreductase
MSSYLSIYIVPKRTSQEEPKKHIILTAYSRSTEIYEYFSNNLHPTFIGNGKESHYTAINSSDITAIMQDFENDLKKAKDRLVEYEKYASNNPDYIEDIIDIKEYIHNLQYWKDKASFIMDIINDKDLYNDIEEVCCNID